MDEVAKLSQKDKVQEAVNASHIPEVSLVPFAWPDRVFVFVPLRMLAHVLPMVQQAPPPPGLQLQRSCLSISTSYEEYSSSLLSPSSSRLLFPPHHLPTGRESEED